MSQFNNETYLEGQVRKQYMEEVKSQCKQVLEIPKFEKTRVEAKKILGKSIRELQESVSKGELDYPSIMTFYLDRIQKNEHLNAVIEINPNCFMASKRCHYSPSHHLVYGMPVLIKGNIGTKDMHTTAGVAALKDLICDDDADIIKKLTSQGAIIIGKANLSEWANFMSTESSNGYSSLGGQSKNPYGHFDVGGSSSGSAVGAAFELAPLTIGTETAGSIIYPSSQNSVVGLKPTLNLLSQNRIIPISESHDTAGPMTKYVSDAYDLLSAMADVEKINFSLNALSHKKMGIVNNDEIVEMYRPDDQDILDGVQKVLLNCGAEVSLFNLDKSAFDTQVYDILKYEFKVGVADFLKTYAPHYEIQNIKDVIGFNAEDMSRYAPFNHEIILQAANEIFDEKIIKAQVAENQRLTCMALDKAFESVDYLVTLSNYCTSVYAPAGYPAITVPAGYRSSGEPIGVTFIGPKNADVKLLEIAYAYEQKTKHRIRPEEAV